MLNWHLECGTAGSYYVFRLRVSTDLVVVKTRNIHHRYSVVDIPSRDTSRNIFHEILRVSTTTRSVETRSRKTEYEPAVPHSKCQFNIVSNNDC